MHSQTYLALYLVGVIAVTLQPTVRGETELDFEYPFQLINEEYGILFAATSGGHGVWTKPNVDYEFKCSATQYCPGKAQWKFETQSDGSYKLINKQYGILYAATTDIDTDGSHVVWTEPNVDYEFKCSATQYCPGKAKWNIEKQSDGSYTLINQQYGILYAATTTATDGTHQVTTFPNNDYEFKCSATQKCPGKALWRIEPPGVVSASDRIAFAQRNPTVLAMSSMISIAIAGAAVFGLVVGIARQWLRPNQSQYSQLPGEA